MGGGYGNFRDPGPGMRIDRVRAPTLRTPGSHFVLSIPCIGSAQAQGGLAGERLSYLNHHLQVAGVKEHRFTEEAILAIQQGSGGEAPNNQQPLPLIK